MSDDNIVLLKTITTHDIPVDRILDGARDKLSEVVVIGICQDGSEYFASSLADGGDVVWHLERAKLKLLMLADDPSRIERLKTQDPEGDVIAFPDPRKPE